MSKTAWAVLSGSVAFTSGVIYYVHKTQRLDRERLREGVLIDLDRQQRKLLNIHQLQVQSDLTKILKEHQKEQDKNDKQLDHSVR